MSEVIDFKSKIKTHEVENTEEDIAVDTILDAAKEANLKEVIVIGLTSENGLTVRTSTGDVTLVHWLISLADKELLDMV